MVAQRADDRYHAVDLLLDRKIGVAGPRRVGAYVEHVGALCGTLARESKRGGQRVGRADQPITGKGVGRQVENAHHACALPPAPQPISERHDTRRERLVQPLPQFAHAQAQARMKQLRREIQHGGQHKVPFGYANVRNRQLGRIDNGVVIEENVEVDGARPVANRLDPFKLIFGQLERPQQIRRRQACCHLADRVKKQWLVRHQHRIRLVEMRCLFHGQIRVHGVQSGMNICRPVADVAAQRDVCCVIHRSSPAESLDSFMQAAPTRQ